MDDADAHFNEIEHYADLQRASPLSRAFFDQNVACIGDARAHGAVLVSGRKDQRSTGAVGHIAMVSGEFGRQA